LAFFVNHLKSAQKYTILEDKGAMSLEWSNFDRYYVLADSKLTKRELLPREQRPNIKGEIIERRGDLR
jgi:hypothetical protein